MRILLLLLAALLSACGITLNVPQNAPEPEVAVATPTSVAVPETPETITPPAVESPEASAQPVTETPAKQQDPTEKEDGMHLAINGTEVPVTWESNASVDALKALGQITVNMSPYGGFEQVGSLGQSIVRADEQTTTSAGDVVLYSGNQIVVFFGSNSWAYTRLGHINLSAEELAGLLGNGGVTLSLS